ncbi:MAG: putative dehydrogenase [Algoriphagus sp.]|jgi:predicted dehydrogenase
MSDNLKIVIVGAGLIAREYVKVLLAMNYSIVVIGRGEARLRALQTDFKEITTVEGGLEAWLKDGNRTDYAIICTQVEYLANATKGLLLAGCKNILVEKPLTYSISEANELLNLEIKYSANIRVAYNRRSYVAVQEAKRLIKQDGGVKSFHFDFTEAIFRIDPKNYDKESNLYWGIANSSHVIDTAFYLAGGLPFRIEANQYGDSVKWHPAGSIFTGVGETKDRIPFTYHANWGCPGKWNIEIMTAERKLLFSPMEQLQQQLKGNFVVKLVDLDYSKDLAYKPGFYNQVDGWIQGRNDLCSIKDLWDSLLIYRNIFGYTED